MQDVPKRGLVTWSLAHWFIIAGIMLAGTSTGLYFYQWYVPSIATLLLSIYCFYNTYRIHKVQSEIDNPQLLLVSRALGTLSVLYITSAITGCEVKKNGGIIPDFNPGKVDHVKAGYGIFFLASWVGVCLLLLKYGPTKKESKHD
ncbi:MAG: hypothetical protein QM703_13605 [Gemmatales bacterium]